MNNDHATIQSKWPFTGIGIGIVLALASGGLDRSVAQTAPPVDNPTLESLRTATYRQPQQRLAAVSKLLDLGEFSLAKDHLEQLAKENLDAAQLAALHRRFGTALFLQLTNEPELQPVGGQWASRVLDAAATLSRDPRQLAHWAHQLAGAEQPAKRYAAMVELRPAGAEAVGPLLAAIAVETDPQNLAWLRKGLTQLGKGAVQPLLAILTSPLEGPGASMREQVMLALGEMDAQPAIPFLIRPYLTGSDAQRMAAATALAELTGGMPSESVAERLLVEAVRREEEAYRKLTLEDRRLRETRLWQWTGAEGLRASDYSLAEATAVRTAQMARDLHRLRPQNSDFRDGYLLAHLEARGLLGSLPTEPDLTEGATDPLPLANLLADPLTADAPSLERLLLAALQSDREAAAARLCQLLGSAGQPAMLDGVQGKRSPLARALRHDDRKVRFAAAEAIFQMDPTGPFPGAADLVHAAEFFASAQGTRRVLIVHPRGEESMAIAGWFENLGWEAEAVETPRQFLKEGLRRADYELFLISDRVYRPTAGELLQLVRRDPRTAKTAVVMMAYGEGLARAERRADGDERTVSFPLPQSDRSVRGLIQIATPLRLPDALSPARRLDQARAAMQWLGRWSADRRRYHFYELLQSESILRDALAVPALSALAAEALGNFGTPDSQQSLLDSASQLGQPLPLRQAAAEGFRRAVQRQGVQLTHSAIRQQYARYNQSVHFDEATQTLLGQILDTIEGPSRNEATKDTTGILGEINTGGSGGAPPTE